MAGMWSRGYRALQKVSSNTVCPRSSAACSATEFVVRVQSRASAVPVSSAPGLASLTEPAPFNSLESCRPNPTWSRLEPNLARFGSLGGVFVEERIDGISPQRLLQTAKRATRPLDRRVVPLL